VVLDDIEQQDDATITEMINDLVRRARQDDEAKELLSQRLEASERSGFVECDPQQLLAEFRSELKSRGGQDLSQPPCAQ
jgi:hypothetical protein